MGILKSVQIYQPIKYLKENSKNLPPKSESL